MDNTCFKSTIAAEAAAQQKKLQHGQAQATFMAQ